MSGGTPEERSSSRPHKGWLFCLPKSVFGECIGTAEIAVPIDQSGRFFL